MLRKLCFATAFMILITCSLHARQIQINRDTLSSILKQPDKLNEQKRLIKFIKNCFQHIQADQSGSVVDTLQLLLKGHNIPDENAFISFIQSLALNKTHNLKNAERYMLQALHLARKANNSYLMYQFLSHLGFIQTDQGNFTGAVYSYRLAQKEALQLKDNYLQTFLFVNISDLYYKSGLYNQSINYLNQAQVLLSNEPANNRGSLLTIIRYNKSENYFRMKNYDSLNVYHKKLLSTDNKSYKLQTYRLRTAYYLSLLKHNYAASIDQIIALKNDKKYVPNELDDQHLADAYFMNGQVDSAKIVANKLLKSSADNHPEIRYHLIELLAQIAENQGKTSIALQNFKSALNELQEYNLRITQLGNISAQMKIDEAENSYIKRTEAYNRERTWLIFIVIVASLITVAIGLIYRNVKQKRHYEKLLYVAKKEELAFINSHEVRKHLTNILGIMDVLKNSTNKAEEYEQLQSYLYQSASLLDKSIKNISEKLNDED